jgi:hypothetical protein
MTKRRHFPLGEDPEARARELRLAWQIRLGALGLIFLGMALGTVNFELGVVVAAIGGTGSMTFWILRLASVPNDFRRR